MEKYQISRKKEPAMFWPLILYPTWTVQWVKRRGQFEYVYTNGFIQPLALKRILKSLVQVFF